jgi:receptor protein-tyrosine kinase
MVFVLPANHERMEFQLAIGDYLRIFRRYWWVVLIAAAVGAGIGYGTTLLSTTQYESTARLFVTTQSGTSVGDAYQNNLFSQERVVSYAGLATSEQVAARAVDQLKASITPDQLRSKITATPLPQTVLLDITAKDTDPAMAQTYANAVADQLVNLASELETSRRGGTPAAGAVLVDDASYGVKAGGLSLLHRILLGAAGGLIVGVVLAIIIGALDSRLRRRERVEELAGSPVLGALVADRHHPDDVLDLTAGGIAAERLRALRTNLQFAHTSDGHRPHVIAVTSPTAGDARSTTAVDLAAAFAETGRSVVLVDGDLVNPSLAERVQLAEAAAVAAKVRGLSTVLAGQHDVSEVMIDTVGHTGFALVPAGPVPSVRRQLWAEASAVGVIEVLRRNFEYVIIDTPPLTTCTDGALAAVLADGAIVLARVGHTKSAALRRAFEVLQSAHAFVIGAVVTCEPGHRRELARDAKKTARKTARADKPAEPSGKKPAEPTGKKSTEPPARPPAARDKHAAAAESARADTAVIEGAGAQRQNGVHRLARSQTDGR